MTQEINQQELQEFWEWCGFYRWNSPNDYIARNWWHNPDPNNNDSHSLPPIDLNSLFRYAVPKVDNVRLIMNVAPSGDVFWNGEVEYSGSEGKVTHEDPALALYQAIQKARRETK